MAQNIKVEVGAEVEALCRTCKGPSIHVIESVKEGVIKKVMCKACLNSHRYKPVEEQEKMTKATPKTKTRRTTTTKTKEERKWSRLLNKVDSESPLDYAMNERYKEKVVINHAKFGLGVVYEVIDQTKISVVFKEGTKILVQNR